MSNEKTYRAGVIPYHIIDDEIKMLFMKPSQKDFGGKKFQIAKGKREVGEDNEEAGFREAREELGLFAGNVTERVDLGNFLGRTRIYLAKIKDPELFGDPCDETGAVKWMSPEEFAEDGRGIHKPIIKAAVRKIQDTR